VKLKEWDERYRSGEAAFDTPVPLIESIAQRLTPGRALDVASGAGRNAIYLARLGWRVKALDGSAAALDTLRSRAGSLSIETELLDLEREALAIGAGAYELIVDSYYLQRELIPVLKRGVAQGGVLIAIVHTGEQATARRMTAGELRSWFEGWKILHYYEGEPSETCHRQPVAEIVARKP
jgi:SAM-dependent methyltransferase